VSAESHGRILFVDFENAGNVDLTAIPADVFVPFFFGACQKSVPTEFLKAALKLGDRFKPIDIEGQGKNALDFHIAFYIGEYLAANPRASCIILSKDKGFDPLVKHLGGRGFSVRRAATIADAVGAPAAAKAKATASDSKSKPDDPLTLDDVLQWLKKMQPRARPAKRKGLLAHLKSHFGQKSSEAELDKVIDQMIAKKKISEMAGKLAYQL
jgi:hypothetical protein